MNLLKNCVLRQVSRVVVYNTRMASSQVQYTQDRYSVKRGDFSEVTETDLSFFEDLLGANGVISDSEELEPYNIDFFRNARGKGRYVLKPKNVSEVSKVLKYCNERGLAVCPQGGNTGLVGGGVPVFDEVIVSTKRMNRVESVDEMTGTIVCEAGCILENLEKLAEEHGLNIPLDLGSKGSCQIGGNISTNAGGLRLLRYGNFHGTVSGVEVVLANGEIVNLMSQYKKDNTGYHLKHLFIGSEGTLGVVTKVALQCPPKRQSVNLAFLGLPSFEAVLDTFLTAKRNLGEILSACEMIDDVSLELGIDGCNSKAPIDKFPFYILIETSGSNNKHDEEKLNSFLQEVMERGLVIDGTIASTPGKVREVWQLRESIAWGIRNAGCSFNYDISVPLRNFYDIVPATKARVGPLATKVCGFGHLGDSNLHLVVICDEYSKEIAGKVEPFVYEFTGKLHGSISAEHGIGFLKSKYLKYSKSPEAIELMRKLKTLLDPNGILNPYKVLQ